MRTYLNIWDIWFNDRKLSTSILRFLINDVGNDEKLKLYLNQTDGLEYMLRIQKDDEILRNKITDSYLTKIYKNNIRNDISEVNEIIENK